jgi:hypothetical protein
MKLKITMGLSNLGDFSSYLQVEGVFISVFKIVEEFARCSRTDECALALMGHGERITPTRFLDSMLTAPFKSGSPS